MEPLTEDDRKRLNEVLEKMRAASADFYEAARRTGNHAFIEFTGLMNEYIVVCGDALELGLDFTLCNTHSGIALPMAGYRAAYLAEKLECIYGPSLVDEKTRSVFLSRLLGVESLTELLRD